MTLETKKERHDAINGLSCLVQALVGKCLTIDLRNESSVTGFIKEVDGYMNISFEKAEFEDYEGNQHKYETLYVKGRNIRFIHIPKQLSVRETIVQFLKKKYPSKSKESMTSLQRYRQKKRQENQERTREAVSEMKRNKKQTEL